MSEIWDRTVGDMDIQFRGPADEDPLAWYAYSWAQLEHKLDFSYNDNEYWPGWVCNGIVGSMKLIGRLYLYLFQAGIIDAADREYDYIFHFPNNSVEKYEQPNQGGAQATSFFHDIQMMFYTLRHQLAPYSWDQWVNDLFDDSTNFGA